MTRPDRDARPVVVWAASATGTTPRMHPHTPGPGHLPGRTPRRRRGNLRVIGFTAAALLSVVTAAACGSDDDDDMNDDGVDQTAVTSASGSAVPGQEQAPVNTDPLDSQVTPTRSP